MKRYCKQANIHDAGFICTAVLECLRKAVKRRRPDTIRLFAELCGTTPGEARVILEKCGKKYDAAVDKLVRIMAAELAAHRLTLPPIHVKEKVDGHSGKVRKISVQEIRQLLYDHVAVMAMAELGKLLGEHQVSGRKGMGLAYGHKLMRKWVTRARGKVYSVKLDIRHYYDSVDTARLMDWLRRRVKNDELLWLVETLICTGERGLNIGSYLSHFLANLYLSDIWHAAMQRMSGVQHALFYMDDMVLIGPNKRKLAAAARQVVEMVQAKGLDVKPGWQVHRITRQHPLDVMGVRFSPRVQTLRKRIFRRARRALLRVKRALRGRRRLTHGMAMRTSAYHGWLVHSSCLAFRQRVGESASMKAIFQQLNPKTTC